MASDQGKKSDRKALTTRALASMSDGSKVTDAGFDPDGVLRGKLRGALIAKRRQGRETVEFFLRTRSGETDQLHKVGYYAPAKREPDPAIPGLTLSEARTLALNLALRYAKEGAGLKAALEAESQERREAEARAAAAAAQRQADADGVGSLGELLNLYVANLRKRGRTSARDVENLFKLHIEKNKPALWKKPAREIAKDDVKSILGAMLEAGIGRRRNVMRSCLSSAFQFGLRLDDDESYSADAEKFKLTASPVAGVARKGELDRAGDRTLSAAEAGAYLRAIEKMPAGVKRAFLETHLRLGGQRVKQLLGAKWTDIRDGVLWLRDAKGRGDPRDHLIPLPDDVAELIGKLPRFVVETGIGDGAKPEVFPFVFSFDGRTALHPTTVSKWIPEVAEGMVNAGTATEPFGAADIRRTAETLLASLNVSKEVRAELLSHGRSGVVARHYDRFEYLPQKRAALAKWNRALAKWKIGETAEVTDLRTAARSR